MRQQHKAEAAGTARRALADPNAYDLTALNEPQRKALIRFWEAWQEELKRLRILDPACGSGAVLIEAFDQLHAVHELSNAEYVFYFTQGASNVACPPFTSVGNKFLP